MHGFRRLGVRGTPLTRDALAISLFALLGFMAFAPVLVLGQGLLDEDIFQQSLPVLGWYGRAARNGQDFLWTSGILGGFPIAFTQYGLISPLDWVAARLFDPDRAFATALALHLPLAGIASYFYARVLGISRLPSLLAGVGYQLSTEALALGANGYLLKSLFLLPTLLLSAELIARRGFRWSALAAGAVGVSLLSGQVYITAIALVNGAIYALARALWLWREGKGERAALLLGSLGSAVLLGSGLAAVRLLPGLTVAAESVRSQGMSLQAASVGSPGIELLLAGYLLPLTRLFGLGIGEFAPPSYVGPLIPILAAIALFRIGRSPWVRILGGMLLLNLLISMGENGPIFGILHQVPPFSFFRVPSRFSMVSAFLLSVLAARALEERELFGSPGGSTKARLKIVAWSSTLLFGLTMAAGFLWLYGGEAGATIRSFAEAHRLGPVNPLRPRIALALAAVPIGLWLLHARATGRLSRTAFQALSVGATACLLMAVGLSMIPLQNARPATPATVRFLENDRSTFRVLSFSPGITVYNYLNYLAQGDPKRIDPHGPSELEFKFRYLAETLAPNLALQYGLESIDGYEVLQSTRQAMAMAYIGSDYAEITDFATRESSADQQELAGKLLRIRARGLLDHLPALRAFSVKYVLTNLELRDRPEELRLAFTSQIPMLDPRAMASVHVYEVVGTLPRAYLVPYGASVSSAVETLDTIISNGVDLKGTVILEGPSPRTLPEPRLDPARSTVELVSRGDSQLVLDVQTDGSGFLVINDAFYPGWIAWVDGQGAPIYVANGWVRAIPIETAGNHTVRLAYLPPLFEEGRWLSLASLVFYLAGLVVLLLGYPRTRYTFTVGPGRS